jgi:hypothetical protein
VRAQRTLRRTGRKYQRLQTTIDEPHILLLPSNLKKSELQHEREMSSSLHTCVAVVASLNSRKREKERYFCMHNTTTAQKQSINLFRMLPTININYIREKLFMIAHYESLTRAMMKKKREIE